MSKFNGFTKPEQNYSKLPHDFVDRLSEIETVAELKVVLYVLRHTWGFSEFDKPKKMTYDEIANGRKRKDGTRIDGGTGLSVNSIHAGAEKAVEHGFLTIETDESDKARIEKWYCLNMADESNFDSSPSKIDTRPSKIEERSEKETIERKELSASRKPDLLDAEIDYHLKPKAIREAMAKYFKLTPNWDGNKYNREWMQWAVEQEVTPAQIERAADLWRSDKRFNWQPPSLKLIQERWLQLVENDKTELPNQDDWL